MQRNRDEGSPQAQPNSPGAEISGLLADLTRPAKDWTTRAATWSLSEARAYVTWLRKWFVRVGVVFGISVAIAGVGIVFGSTDFVPIALIVAALLLGLLTLISFPILVIAATFSQLRPVGMAFRSAMWVLTWLFGLVLLFLVVPVSPSGVLVVMVASLFLSSLYLATGQVPNIGVVRTRAVSVVVVTILLAFVANVFPQVSNTAARVVRTFDGTLNRWISSEVLTPKPVRVGTSTECWNMVFFGPDGEPLFWYETDTRGQQRLFSSAGRSPLTGAPLTPVTRDIRDAYCEGLEQEERRATVPSVATRGVPHAVRTEPEQPARTPPPRQAPASVEEDRQALIASEIAAVETLMNAGPVTAFDAKPEWISELSGKTAVVRFSPNARRIAASVAGRLQQMGMSVVIEPLLIDGSLRRPTINYSQSEIHSASALNAVLADISQFDLDSHVAAVPLSVDLP
jgi:hypothetical protein